jgi:hypothetical protein
VDRILPTESRFAWKAVDIALEIIGDLAANILSVCKVLFSFW